MLILCVNKTIFRGPCADLSTQFLSVEDAAPMDDNGTIESSERLSDLTSYPHDADSAANDAKTIDGPRLSETKTNPVEEHDDGIHGQQGFATNERLPSENTLIDASDVPDFNMEDASRRPLKPVRNQSKSTQSSSKTTNREWRRSLYSSDAGLVKNGASIMKKCQKKVIMGPVAVQQLQQYADYEFETFTFLQEIIPNLFLGRFSALEAS
jgi:hypothetical protein